jgi:thiamine biosynthesis lipoprotein
MFRAMSTRVVVTVPEASPRREQSLAARIERHFAATEDTFSRFRADSELRRLHADSGPVKVSTELFEAIERARAYWELTDGWFDVSIGRALCEAGYDRNFEPGGFDRRTRPGVPGRATSSFADVRLDRAAHTIELPAGMFLDCGGFIKGWAADRAMAYLPGLAAVDAGGDAVLRRAGVDGRGWPVAVEDPWLPGRVMFRFRVRDGAVATSGSNRRRWRIGRREVHHLINPYTSEPAVTDLVQVTVRAPCAELADVLAKTVFLRGSRDGTKFLHRFSDVAALLVLRDGQIQIQGQVEIDHRADRGHDNSLREKT